MPSLSFYLPVRRISSNFVKISNFKSRRHVLLSTRRVASQSPSTKGATF